MTLSEGQTKIPVNLVPATNPLAAVTRYLPVIYFQHQSINNQPSNDSRARSETLLMSRGRVNIQMGISGVQPLIEVTQQPPTSIPSISQVVIQGAPLMPHSRVMECK